MRRFPRLRTTFAQALLSPSLYCHGPNGSDEVVRHEDAYSSQGSPDWVHGECILVKCSVLDQLQGFDEALLHVLRRHRPLPPNQRSLARDLIRTGRDRSCTREEPRCHGQRCCRSPRIESKPLRSETPSLAPVALLERAGVATGALTHAIVSRGGLGDAARMAACVRACSLSPTPVLQGSARVSPDPGGVRFSGAPPPRLRGPGRTKSRNVTWMKPRASKVNMPTAYAETAAVTATSNHPRGESSFFVARPSRRSTVRNSSSHASPPTTPTSKERPQPLIVQDAGVGIRPGGDARPKAVAHNRAARPLLPSVGPRSATRPDELHEPASACCSCDETVLREKSLLE